MIQLMAPTEDANIRLSANWNADRLCSSPPGGEQIAVKSPPRDPLELSLSLQDLDNTCEIYFCGWDSDLAATNTTVRHLSVPEASADFRRAMVTPEPVEVPRLSRTSSPSLPALSSKSQSLTSPRQQNRSPSPTSPRSKTRSSSSSSLPSTSSSSPSPPSSSSSSSLSLSPSSSTNFKPTLAAALSLVLSPLNPESKSKKSRARLWQGPLHLPSIEPLTNSEFASTGPLSNRRPASFGDADRVRYRQEQGRRASHGEKHVSWADEFGSASKLTSVRLIRPRLDATDSSKKSGTPASIPVRSILRDTGAK